MSTIKITAAPWKIVEIKHPFKTKGFTFGNKTVAPSEGFHIERQIYTAWEHGQAKSCVPVVGYSLGIGIDDPVRFIHIDEGDALLIKAAPLLLIALHEIARSSDKDSSNIAKKVLADNGLDDVEIINFSDFVSKDML
jgi:hypothetical protein